LIQRWNAPAAGGFAKTRLTAGRRFLSGNRQVRYDKWHNPMRRFFALLLVLTALSPALPASARGDRDHDAARKAFERGEILPLSDILKRLQKTAPGEVLEVELEREDGRLIYEIEILERSGRVLEYEIDARTGDILKVEGDD